jgi:cytochrome P450
VGRPIPAKVLVTNYELRVTNSPQRHRGTEKGRGTSKMSVLFIPHPSSFILSGCSSVLWYLQGGIMFTEQKVTTANNFESAFNPLVMPYLDNPYPIYEQARREKPIFYSPELDMWVISRYEEINQIFKDPARFSASIAQAPLYPVTAEAQEVLKKDFHFVPVMSSCDPPNHTRIRSFLNKAFSARRMAVLKPQIYDLTNELINAFAQDGKADLIEQLTFPLPALVIFTMLGIPDEDRDKVKSWCDDRLLFFWGALPTDKQVQCARNLVAYWKYCEELVEKRLTNPQDDFTSDLLEARRGNEDALSIQEVTSIVYGLSFAGHETTTNLIGNSLKQLLNRPAEWEMIRKQPELIPNVVEENLRFDTSVTIWRRITTQEVEVGGVSIPKGAKLALLLASGNHDEAQFPDPERFDVHRSNANGHLAFGKGIHFCLGAALARLQNQIVLELMTGRFPDMRLSNGQIIEYVPNLSFRGPKHLWAEWTV